MQILDFWDHILNLHIINSAYKKTPKKKNCNIQLLWVKIMSDRMYQKQNLPTSHDCDQTSQEIKIVSPCVTIISVLLLKRGHVGAMEGCGGRLFYTAWPIREEWQCFGVLCRKWWIFCLPQSIIPIKSKTRTLNYKLYKKTYTDHWQNRPQVSWKNSKISGQFHTFNKHSRKYGETNRILFYIFQLASESPNYTPSFPPCPLIRDTEQCISQHFQKIVLQNHAVNKICSIHFFLALLSYHI